VTTPYGLVLFFRCSRSSSENLPGACYAWSLTAQVDARWHTSFNQGARLRAAPSTLPTIHLLLPHFHRLHLHRRRFHHCHHIGSGPEKTPPHITTAHRRETQAYRPVLDHADYKIAAPTKLRLPPTLFLPPPPSAPITNAIAAPRRRPQRVCKNVYQANKEPDCRP
jgi:hypothetical protein